MKDRVEEEIEIDRYVSEEMNEAEKSVFEKKLALDNVLARRLEEHRLFLSNLDSFKRRIKLKEQLEEVHGNMSNTSTEIRQPENKTFSKNIISLFQ